MFLSTVIILGVTLGLGVVGLVTLSSAVATKSWKSLLWLIPHAGAVGFCMFALHDVTHWTFWDYLLTGGIGFAVYIVLGILAVLSLIKRENLLRKAFASKRGRS
jgi:hypothetical protein